MENILEVAKSTEKTVVYQSENIFEVTNFVDGKFIKNNILTRDIFSIDEQPLFKIYDASPWTIEYALATANRIQHELELIPVEKIIAVLSKSMTYYFDDESKLIPIVQATGSPLSFVKDTIRQMKDWVRNIDIFYAHLTNDTNIHYRNSSPVIAILPSNSDAESILVIAQVLLSKNAAIIRPSRKGSSAYSTLEFIQAFNTAIDDFADRALEILKSAVAMINIGHYDYLEQLCMDGANYLFFGDEKTTQTIRESVNSYCKPRKVFGFGTGLSTTIILDDIASETVDEILQSISFNAGNECISTDIVYIHTDIYEPVLSKLMRQSQKFKSGDPFDSDSIGLLLPQNIDYIEQEIGKYGKQNYLNTSYFKGSKQIHTSIIPLNIYEAAIEYPGPIASVRVFTDLTELQRLIKMDLVHNEMSKNLVTSIYTISEERFQKTKQVTQTYLVKRNKPTTSFEPMLPHQGVYLMKEFMDPVFIDQKHSY